MDKDAFTFICADIEKVLGGEGWGVNIEPSENRRDFLIHVAAEAITLIEREDRRGNVHEVE